MKKAIVALFMLTSICCNAGLACADGSPVIVTHTLTSSTKGEPQTALNLTVNVVNPGDDPITSLVLSLDPMPPFMPGQITLEVATLGPHESVERSLQVTMLVPPNVGDISRRPIIWSGKCVDVQGNTVEFHTASNPGGAQ